MSLYDEEDDYFTMRSLTLRINKKCEEDRMKVGKQLTDRLRACLKKRGMLGTGVEGKISSSGLVTFGG